MQMTERERNEEALSPVTALQGVGPVRAKAYEKLGVRTLLDLVYHFPRGYEDRGNVKLLSETPNGTERAAVILTVSTEPRVTTVKRRMTLLKFRAFDESGTAEITYFQQGYLKDAFAVGREYRFYGKVTHPVSPRGRYLLSAPAHEAISEDRELPPFVPVYPLSEGLSAGTVSRDIGNALRRVLPLLSDPLPSEIREKYGLCTLQYAIQYIQMPTDYAALARAKRRLIFDEFFAFALTAAKHSAKRVRTDAAVCRPPSLDAFYGLLPYRLTGAQSRAVSEIVSDMGKEAPMNRILIGDVGSGKTVVAATAILCALCNGHQAALMAPTEILATQHYAELSRYLRALGFTCALLTGATPAAEKRRILTGLRTPEKSERIDLVIGTHALISDGVEFASAALAVTDEQHRFGVGQRAELLKKCKNAHLLAMSATPIPRSLALTLYGDLDVSYLDEMPPGRQRVETFAVDERYRERLVRFMEKQVEGGGQVYVVCPSIEDAERADGEEDFSLSDVSEDGRYNAETKYPLKSAVSYCEALRAALPHRTVALMHGKMKPKEKDAIMARFSAGETQILVSTTVIEVGVNVPNATLMVVENAERFGLSQLHQLRGRVGRGTQKAYCVLVSEAASETSESPSVAYQRLRTLCENYDGFSIAEHDLRQRGPGDFFGQMMREGGIRQSGGLRFRLADLATDAELFRDATEEAKRILREDPMLSAHPSLTGLLARYRENDAETLN